MKGTVRFLLVCGIVALGAKALFAHCDTMDGPVVQDARKALEAKTPDAVLKWVRQEDEGKIKAAFEKTLSARKGDPKTRELADNYFFETLVRIHRAGEGEPYTGLLPAGTEVEPGIRLADEAVEKGTGGALVSEISELISHGLKERFDRVMETRKHKDESVASGREYVEAYVRFIHFTEELHALLTHAPSHGGSGESRKH